jgi:hypothetical protein
LLAEEEAAAADEWRTKLQAAGVTSGELEPVDGS